ncbi:MAG TPA: hypothetical protein VGL93_15280 [Streptosporangiaceae bacterium]|jgi:hypothetical protein
MQTETPLYVADVLGEIDNSETVADERQVKIAPRPARGPALFVSDRRHAARRHGERGSIFEWLALGVLAAVIVAALAASGIGDTISGAITSVVGKITGISTTGGTDSGSKADAKTKANCDARKGTWKDNKCS